MRGEAGGELRALAGKLFHTIGAVSTPAPTESNRRLRKTRTERTLGRLISRSSTAVHVCIHGFYASRKLLFSTYKL